MSDPDDADLIARIRHKLDYSNAPFGRDCHGIPWRLDIEPLLFGMARIIVTDGSSVEKWWEYETEGEAHGSVDVWMGLRFEGEPTGWRRAYPIDPKDAFNNSKIRYREGLREEQRAAIQEKGIRLVPLSDRDRLTLLRDAKLPVVKYQPGKDIVPWR